VATPGLGLVLRKRKALSLLPFDPRAYVPLEEIGGVLLKPWRDAGAFGQQIIRESVRSADCCLTRGDLGPPAGTRIVEANVLNGGAVLSLDGQELVLFSIPHDVFLPNGPGCGPTVL
jgi:hypothetical protein